VFTARYVLKLLYNSAMPWHRWLVAGHSRQKSGYDPWPFRVRFMVDKVALGQGFSPSTSALPSQYHSTNASVFIFIYQLLFQEG
jgi:hypothetical protein